MAAKADVGGRCVVAALTTEELLTELRRRCLGCMAVCVQVDETGDAWQYALKGSPIMLGAMSAALSLKTTEMLAMER